ncbi:MAG: CRISPR-associated exonuclease, Cas4 family [Clostridia bacterium]|nr:CRISPR-associated exonuclease, Cas4 family [Clostridia bacterium]
MDIKVITGTMFYYYFVCHRKLWYFSKDITLECTNEKVALGKLLDENSYNRDEKHISIDNAISIDFIRGRDILHEVKKTKSIEEAAIWQVKYYLYYLRKRGAIIESARLDFPLIRETKTVTLEEGDGEKIEHILTQIDDILNRAIPPEAINSKICKSCAYFELCYI